MLGERTTGLTFLSRLDPDARDALVGAGVQRHYRPGNPVYQEGGKADTIAVLMDGRVKISTVTPDGRDVLLAFRSAGDLLGEMSTLVGEPRTARVIAIDPVRLLIVPFGVFDQLLDEHQGLVAALLQTLVDRVVDSDRHRVELEHETDQRLVLQLIRLMDRFGTPGADGSVVVDLPLSQDDLASLILASRGAVARALRDLRHDAVVRTARRKLVICDPAALRRRGEPRTSPV